MRQIGTVLGKIAIFGKYVAEKETLIFLHGVFLSHEIWSDYASAFSPEYNVLMVDWPGHGKSEAPKRNWSISDSVTALDQIIESLNTGQVTLIGHSWGGMAAARYAAKNPNKVKAIALFNTPLARLTTINRTLQIFQMFALPFKKFYGSQAANFIYESSSLEFHPEWKYEVIKHFYSNKIIIDTVRLINAILLRTENSFDLVDNSKVPMLIVVGKDNSIFESYKKSAPQSFIDKVHVIAGGHTAARESSVDGIQLLSDFLKDISKLRLSNESF